MTRAFLFILDSVGIGGAPDAAQFGDVGSNTLGHIAQQYRMQLPNLEKMGLGSALKAASGDNFGLGETTRTGGWGYAIEQSRGKDTPSGHWEIAGVPVRFDWGYFPRTIPAMPKSLTDALIAEGEIGGILANCHASGTEVIAQFGAEHVRTGWPILYTSADSVIQIAAHEEAFGLERLYGLCRIARELSFDLNIGRVIARPFTGKDGAFVRTANRKDYSVLPPMPTLFDALTRAGRTVISVGKIGDIYAHSGTGEEIKAAGNDALMTTTLAAMDRLPEGGFLATNFVDFDMMFGHRRDVSGYAQALEHFDRRLPEALQKLRPGDLLIITADHGCDPTWVGTDHTRECVPVLSNLERPIGQRASFADMGQTIAHHLGIAPLAFGKAW